MLYLELTFLRVWMVIIGMYLVYMELIKEYKKRMMLYNLLAKP